MDPSQDLKRTPLYETHVEMGGRIVPFSGWEMPVQYASILAEVKAVRSAAGLFDVSHMGRVEIDGPGAGAFLNRVLSVDVPGLRVGRARYNLICNEEGGIIDDCIVYRRGEEGFLLIPNAGNRLAVLEWLTQWAPPSDDVRIQDVTLRSAMIAHQGPQAEAMLQGLTSADLSTIRLFRAIDTEVAGVETMVARTGYTGEDGFELILPSENATNIWLQLVERGAAACGLGARDTLRLEAGLLLHGNDMDTSTNPYEAGLDRFVDPDREGYVARESLTRVRDSGPARRLAAFRMLERGIPRHGYRIVDGAKQLGVVSSGGPSPSLDMNIGLGYVPTDYSAPGSHMQIEIRGRPLEAEVVSLPFYSRRRSA